MKTLLVIFGITGDLAGRKLLPALDSIVEAQNDSDELGILGVSRREVDSAELLKNHPRLVSRSQVFTMDLATFSEYERLKVRLDSVEAEKVLFYLSVPPGAAADIVDFLGQSGLNSERYQILFEKPFGYDLTSAQEFIERTSRYFVESQLYRIDHYMAKEIAAEVINLRRNAENYHHHWSNESVKAVTIVASEKIGVEGRGQFYEQTGALRDFIQGHLMQLLSLILIHKPGQLSLPEERLAALEQVIVANPEKAVRGQYVGYQEEVENPGSRVETFALLELESADPRWQGVPFRLVTGKALAAKRSYIQIEYKDGKVDIFEEGSAVPEGSRTLDAYERVLLEAMAGNEDIFTTSPEVLRSWEIVAPVQEAWTMDNAELISYAPGTSFEVPDTTSPQ